MLIKYETTIDTDQHIKLPLQPGPQRENFPGVTKIDIDPQILLGPPSLIGAHAVKPYFVPWV